MPKLLTPDQVDAYRRDGFVSPIPVLTAGEVAALRGELEAYEASIGHPLDFPEKSKSYLLFGWADAIVHHPRVLDAVEDVIGPDILVYHTTMWTKEARQPAFVHWHQDGAYFYLDPPEQVTAWVALTDAESAAGCVRVIPGSHRRGALDHFDDPSPLNMIRRGQGIAGFGEADGVEMPLKAGEMSLHHTFAVHSSRGNGSDHRRMGLGISYIPAHVMQRGEPKASALLVRGADRHGNFVRERRLDRPLSAAARAAHHDACERFRLRQNAGAALAPAG